jgi:hypothetical protein
MARVPPTMSGFSGAEAARVRAHDVEEGVVAADGDGWESGAVVDQHAVVMDAVGVHLHDQRGHVDRRPSSRVKLRQLERDASTSGGPG